MPQGTHHRSEANKYWGETDTCQQYNLDLAHIFAIIKDQMERPGNEAFRFTIEAPESVAPKILWFKLIETARANGGLGAKRLTIDFCHFGCRYRKRTYIWTNLETMIAEYDKEDHCRKCTPANPCPFYGVGTHDRIGHDIATVDVTWFPPELCLDLKRHVEACCAKRRCEASD